MSLRINARAATAEHPEDAYFTPPEAVQALMAIEKLPASIADPCCGSGAILDVLEAGGHVVHGADILDYGWGPGRTMIRDYLAEPVAMNGVGIVTNPPYRLAEAFIRKALADRCHYHAWLLRTNFLESVGRLPFWRDHPPSRIWISSRRLPMIHRLGWEGKKAASNVCYAWFIWDMRKKEVCRLDWFDWLHLGVVATDEDRRPARNLMLYSTKKVQTPGNASVFNGLAGGPPLTKRLRSRLIAQREGAVLGGSGALEIHHCHAEKDFVSMPTINENPTARKPAAETLPPGIYRGPKRGTPLRLKRDLHPPPPRQAPQPVKQAPPPVPRPPAIIIRHPCARQAKRPAVRHVSRWCSGKSPPSDPDGPGRRSSPLRLIINHPERLAAWRLPSGRLRVTISDPSLGRAGPFHITTQDFHNLCAVARGLENRGRAS